MSRRRSKTRPTRSTASAARSNPFLNFAREHRDVYRIIDEAEFVEPAAYREHYETTATRIAARFKAARDKGELAQDLTDRDLDILAWASMGANVFLGLKFEVWSSADAKAHRRGDQPAAAQGPRRMNDAAAGNGLRRPIFHRPRRAEAPLSRLSGQTPTSRRILCLPGLTRNAKDFADLAERYSPALPRARARIPRPRA